MPADVRLDTDMDALVRELFEIERPLVDALDYRLGLVFDRAVRLSPVKTGKFQGSFRYRRTLDGAGNLLREIVNSDPKSWYVHRGKVIRELVFAAGEDAASRVLDDTADRWGD